MTPEYWEQLYVILSEGLVSVVFCLVRTGDIDAEVVRLLGCEGSEVNPELAEVQAGNFFIQLLGQDADFSTGQGATTLPERYLREYLVCETIAHHK